MTPLWTRAALLSVVIFLAPIVFSGASSAAEFQVGVSPSVVDLGDVDPGSVQTVKFNVVTPSTDPLLINLQAESGGLDFFGSSKYGSLLDEYSEEDVVPWVNFIQNPFELSTSDVSPSSPPGARGWREISFLIQIPRDAEPGYHTVKIDPIPSTPSESIGGAGARIVAVTSVTVIFRVRGDASRSGLILDVVRGNFVGTGLEMNTYFQNTGTVTVSARTAQRVLQNGTEVARASSGMDYVAPGSTKDFITLLPAASVPPGDYDVSTEVSFETGSSSKNSTMSVYQVAPAIAARQQAEEFPWTIVAVLILVVVIISVLIYRWYG